MGLHFLACLYHLLVSISFSLLDLSLPSGTELYLNPVLLLLQLGRICINLHLLKNPHIVIILGCCKKKEKQVAKSLGEGNRLIKLPKTKWTEEVRNFGSV